MRAIKKHMTLEHETLELTPAVVTPPSPEVPPKEEPVVDPTPPAPEVKPDENLFETPDGRKVDAATLQREWKENFLPEFTRKSQRLAEIDREKDLNRPNDEPAWKKPDYVPQNYAEVIEFAKKEALNEIQSTYEAEQARIKSVQDAVDGELTEIKKTDPKLDENALFQHANKYGFSSLKTAHSNMLDMKKTALEVEQRTVKNIKTRDADPISTGHGGELPDTGGYDPREMSQFDSATAYLQFIKGKK
jgi:hypothetical protein